MTNETNIYLEISKTLIKLRYNVENLYSIKKSGGCKTYKMLDKLSDHINNRIRGSTN